MLRTSRKIMLLSVRPAFAQGIVTGSKRVELRRTRPNIPADQLAVIYASTPVKAAVGACMISHLESGAPTQIKMRYLSEAEITEDAFDSYFVNADVAWALHLQRSVLFEEPVSLERLRGSSVEPVQSWRFLNWRALSTLLSSRRSR